jgi:hypothetical protein
MKLPARGFLLLALLATGAASAQVYKIVGPDGKVSYSDRPPPEPNAKVSVMKPHGAAAEVALPPGSPSSGAGAAQKPSPEQARETLKILAANPGLVAGIAAVLDMRELVDQTTALCARMPNARQYLAARDAWSLRNGQVLSQHRKIYESLYVPENRSSLEKGIAERAAKTLAVVGQANEASKAKWCDTSMEEVRAGKMDLSGKDGVEALMKFKKP